MAAFQPLLLLLLILTESVVVESADPIVTTNKGRIRGREVKLKDGSVNMFLGIPYAAPPIGSYRFLRPFPVNAWTQLKDVSSLPNSCYQVRDTTYRGFAGAEMWNPNTAMSEDCLYLNVWAPVFKTAPPRPEDRVPVLVWIYGGAFMSGTSTLPVYQAYYLCKDQNVVVVSMNYRLGPLGFLAIEGHEHIRGNQGLWDQRMALKWVADNIAAFGGDPKKVTIFGESAGAASVGYHLLSPGSQGLFQRAVMQSGAPNAAWAIAKQKTIYERSIKLAQMMGCPVGVGHKMGYCLQDRYVVDMINKQFENIVPPSVLPYPFVPSIDGDFVPDNIETLLNLTTLPKKELFIGLNKDEGTYFLFYGMPGFTRYGEGAIHRLDFMEGVPMVTNSSDIIQEAVIYDYTNWKDETDLLYNRDGMAGMVGDSVINCPVINFATKYAEHGGNTFFYFFDHVSSKNPWPKWAGAMHGYEIEFIFGLPLNPALKYTDNEVAVSKLMMQHFGDFARTGNPKFKGGDWPLFKPDTQEYATLNNDTPGIRKMYKANECHLWNNLFPKFQNLTDYLKHCSSSGIIQCNWVFLLILLVISLTH